MHAQTLVTYPCPQHMAHDAHRRSQPGRGSEGDGGSGGRQGDAPFPHPELAGADGEGDTPLVLPTGADMDWREFRARLVARTAPPDPVAKAKSGGGGGGGDEGANKVGAGAADVWAHSIPAPEKGCLLLAHPLMFLG